MDRKLWDYGRPGEAVSNPLTALWIRFSRVTGTDASFSIDHKQRGIEPGDEQSSPKTPLC